MDGVTCVCDATLGLFGLLDFPVELICVCARLSAKTLHGSHGLTQTWVYKGLGGLKYFIVCVM